MPAQSAHLRYIEIKDFSPGLWERVDWLMPASGAQQLTNAYPTEGGGLRAFFKGTTILTTGIVSPSTERVIGLHARGGIPARSGSPTDLVDRYLVTYVSNGATNRPKLYRMDGSNSEATWTQIFKTSGVTEFASAGANDAPSKASFRFFKLSSGSPNDQHVLLVLRYVSGDSGLYRLNYNDLSSAQKAILLTTLVVGAAQPSGPIAIHQARIAIGAGNSEKLVWSNPGTETFDAPNFLDVEPNQDLPVLAAMAPMEPSDLLILKEGAPGVIVQGDITDPQLQQMSEGINGIGDFGRSPTGLTIVSQGGNVYVTDGRTWTAISDQLGDYSPANNTVVMGDTNFINDFLFAPGGKVFYFPTKSWFKQTEMAGSFHNVERYTGHIWGPTVDGTSFGLKKIIVKQNQPRVSTYTWQSAPLRSDDGRQIRVREIEIYAKDYDGSATLAVTVNGTTNTQLMNGSGVRQALRFLFNERAEVLDVTVVSTAGNPSNEAPSIESIRIGVGVGHLTVVN